ncbi:hypothetical protein ES708_24280 [subsurface metagenome]
MEKPRLSPSEYLKTIEVPGKPGQYKKGTMTYAGYVAYNSKPRELGGPHTKIKVYIWINCDGYPIPRILTDRGTTVYAKSCPGAEWAHPDYNCDSEYSWHEFPDTFHDMRTLKQMLGGCCPITAISEQLGGETEAT